MTTISTAFPSKGRRITVFVQARSQLSGTKCRKYPNAIRANTSQYPSINCGKSCGRKVVNIWFSISMDVENSALRKKIQQKQTKWNVIRTPKNGGFHDFSLLFTSAQSHPELMHRKSNAVQHAP